MRIVEGTVFDLLEGRVSYRIPIYQRKYSWDESDCIKLLEDIIKVARDEKRTKHFIGSVIYLSCGDTNQSAIRINQVIDGQQRLTTLSLLLIALADYHSLLGGDDSSDLSFGAISEYYLVNARRTDETAYKINLTSEDFGVYKALIASGSRTVPEDMRGNRVYRNYSALLKAMRESGEAPEIIYKGITKLALADVCIDTTDNAQLVFETVNSTGKKLSVADKVRNFVLMNAHGDMLTHIYETYWHKMELSFGLNVNDSWEQVFNGFIRYYVGVLSKDKVAEDYYDTFKSYFYCTAEDIESRVSAMYSYSRLYLHWLSTDESSRGIDKLLYNIKSLEQGQIIPTVLEIMSNRNNALITADETASILSLIESYLMRRKLCKLDSKDVPFSAIQKSIGSYGELLECIRKFTDNQRMPNDMELFTTLPTLRIYKNRRDASRLLWRIEQHVNKDLAYSAIPANYSIEHIMPRTVQSSRALYSREDYSDLRKSQLDWAKDLGSDWSFVHETYCHTVGNLTLTGYNSEYSNLRFVLKRDMEDTENGVRYGYKYTPIHISSSLARLDKWGKEEILDRATEMIDFITEIWRCPEELQTSGYCSGVFRKTVTANDIRAGIISVPSAIVRRIPCNTKKTDVTLIINGQDTYTVSFNPGRNYLGGVSEILKGYGFRDESRSIVEKVAVWSVDENGYVHITFE